MSIQNKSMLSATLTNTLFKKHKTWSNDEKKIIHWVKFQNQASKQLKGYILNSSLYYVSILNFSSILLFWLSFENYNWRNISLCNSKKVLEKKKHGISHWISLPLHDCEQKLWNLTWQFCFSKLIYSASTE